MENKTITNTRTLEPYRPYLRKLTILGLPLIGGYLASFAIGLTDTIMLGWYSVEALAGGVLGSSFFLTLLLLGSGAAQAVMPIVAAAGDDNQRIRRVTRMALWLSMLFSVVSLVPFYLAEPILLRLGQPPNVAAAAGDYLRVAGWGMFPALVVMVLKSYLAALERVNAVLWITVASAVANAIINALLIFGNLGFPEWGIVGAAVASVVSNTVALIGAVLYALRRHPEHELFVRWWRIDVDAMREVFQLGWPIALTLLAEVGFFAASALLMGRVGTIALAAHGITLQIATATFMVQLGLSNAATIIAGQAYGKRDRTALVDGAKSSLGMALVIASIACVGMLAFGESLIGAFLDPEEALREEIIAIGVKLLYLAVLFHLFDSVQVIVLGILRGVHDTRVPMALATISYWLIGLPTAMWLAFGLGWGGTGVWSGLVAGLVTAAILLSGWFWRVWLPRFDRQLNEAATASESA